jgi:hypothetical protein
MVNERSKMARIAPHHSPNHPMPSDEDYALTLEWDDKVYVQWGRYQAGEAFFEAFTDEGVMIRADEATLEEAEAKAHALYAKETACKHEWQRLDYTNGVGTCRYCKLRNTKAFKSIPRLGSHKEPLNYHDLSFIKNSGLRPREFKMRDNVKYKRILTIKARLMGIKLPDLPAAPQTEDEFIEHVPDRYKVGCREAVSIWLHDTIEDGTNHLDPIYQEMLKKHISSSRTTDNRRWARAANRTSLRSPLQIEHPLHKIEQSGDTVSIDIDGHTYQPSAGPGHFDNMGRVDAGNGGLLEGDIVAVRLSDDLDQSILYLEDGRQLHWARKA